MHRRRGVDLARNPVMALHVENERIEGALPTDEVERMMAEGDPRHLPAGVLHVDRKLAALIAVRRESRGLDLRLDDGRHQGGLAFLVEVMRREVDRIHRLDQEEPGLRRRQVDPVRRPFRDRDVHVLPEFQVAVLGPDHALAVLDEVHLMPLAVPEEGLLRHGFRRLGDGEGRARSVNDRLAAADRVSFVRHAPGEYVVRLEDVGVRREVGREGEIRLPRRLDLFRRIRSDVDLAGPGAAEAVGAVDLLAGEDLGDGVELRVRGRRDRPLLHDQDHRGVLRWP